MNAITTLPSSVTEKLRHYVYIYIDPRDESVFYVGKGKGNRAFAHLKDGKESAKVKRIKDIEAEKKKARIEILVHGLDEQTALKVEASVIDLLGPSMLTNAVRGYQSRTHGRMKIDQINGLYQAGPAKIEEPSMLIRINKLYRHTMSPMDLYEATRGYWKVNAKRSAKAQLAIAVYQGIIREVYEIEQWLRAMTTFTNRDEEKSGVEDRWEFIVRIAPPKLRKKYLYRSVAHVFEGKGRNPIHYLNC
jgi:hypothetical protein